jgi:hypothetical protein
MQGIVMLPIIMVNQNPSPLCIEQPLKIHNPKVMIECLLSAREKNC